jgi:hypothetical protein
VEEIEDKCKTQILQNAGKLFVQFSEDSYLWEKKNKPFLKSTNSLKCVNEHMKDTQEISEQNFLHCIVMILFLGFHL